MSLHIIQISSYLATQQSNNPNQFLSSYTAIQQCKSVLSSSQSKSVEQSDNLTIQVSFIQPQNSNQFYPAIQQSKSKSSHLLREQSISLASVPAQHFVNPLWIIICSHSNPHEISFCLEKTLSYSCRLLELTVTCLECAIE